MIKAIKMTIIHVDNLKTSFITKKGPFFHRKKELVTAVDGISFSIERGQFLTCSVPMAPGKQRLSKYLRHFWFLIPEKRMYMVLMLPKMILKFAGSWLRSYLASEPYSGSWPLKRTSYISAPFTGSGAGMWKEMRKSSFRLNAATMTFH